MLNKLSIKSQVTFLFIICLTVTAIIISAANVTLRNQSLATLANEIFDNQEILFSKVQESAFSRMAYYAYSADPGASAIWRLRGRRSPIEAVKSGNQRRIELALSATYNKLNESGTLDAIGIFQRDGTLIGQLPTEGEMSTELGRQLADASFNRSQSRGFAAVNGKLQQHVIFPIYANATVVAYVYFGRDFKRLAEVFEADSNSLLISNNFSASNTEPSNDAMSNISANDTDHNNILTVDGKRHVVARYPLSLSNSAIEELIFAKNVEQVIATTDKYFIQGILFAAAFLVLSGIVIFVMLRTRLNPLNDALTVLKNISDGNLSNQIVKRQDDEIGQIVEALASLQEQLLMFVTQKAEADKLTKVQQDQILQQTVTLANLLPTERRSAMEETILEIRREIEKYNGAEQKGLTFDIVEDPVGTLFTKSFSSLATELSSQYDQLELLVQQRTAELEVARDQANAASDAKSKFLANMTHELRTPLNAIIGYSEMLMEEAEEASELEWLLADLARIKSSAVHQLQLINDILDHSKIEAGKLDLFVEKFTLAETIGFIQSISAPLAQKNGNEILFEIAENFGHMLSDETRLRQILLNLLSNACKFTHDGIVTLTVQGYTKDNAPWVSFCISDTGIGMSQDQVDKIFQEFTQAEAGTAAKFGGTGLGLTITKRLVEMMGGEIDVQSQPDRGSAFTIALPKKIDRTTIS